MDITIKINNTEFKLTVHVIENLLCALIIGDNFLSKNNAQIKFKDKILLLNNKTFVNLIHNTIINNI